jgi:hypothetical protein
MNAQKCGPMKKIAFLFKEKPDRYYSGNDSELVALYADDTSEMTLSDLIELK